VHINKHDYTVKYLNIEHLYISGFKSFFRKLCTATFRVGSRICDGLIFVNGNLKDEFHVYCIHVSTFLCYHIFYVHWLNDVKAIRKRCRCCALYGMFGTLICCFTL